MEPDEFNQRVKQTNEELKGKTHRVPLPFPVHRRPKPATLPSNIVWVT